MSKHARRTFILAGCASIVTTLAARTGVAQPSWEAHLKQLSTKVPKSKCALYGHDSTFWAGNRFDAAEVKYIISGFGDPKILLASGPKLDGKKYMATRADDHLIVIKQGQDGALFLKTSRSVIACKFNEADITPANANIAVQAFGEQMKTLGF